MSCAAQSRGPAVLPDNGPVQGAAAVAVEGDQGLALVGDPNGRDGLVGVGEAGSDLGQGGKDALEDLGGVVFDPARSGEILGEFAVGDVADPAAFIDDDGPYPGGPSVDGHEFSHAKGR